MNDSVQCGSRLPPDQQAIRDRCFHPSGGFVEFSLEDVETSIAARFDKIVSQHPSQPAISSERYLWSFRDLDLAANRICRAILASATDSTTTVGLLFDNDAPLVAGMIGILKAGKAVLLLDPSLPTDRIGRMLDGADARLIICDANNLSLARSAGAGHCRVLEWQNTVLDTSDLTPLPPVRSDDMAFLFFTSGSTGEPKGVVHHHRTMLHNVMLRTNSGKLCIHDRIALPRSGTSAAIANLLSAILNGAALYPFDFRKEGPARLAQWLEQQAITICTLSAPLFRSLGDVVTTPSFPRMRLVMVTSQAMYASDLQLYKRSFTPNSVLLNRLSSSETGPLAEYAMSHQTVIGENGVPVGYPQKEILLLDDDGGPVGFDRIGEMVVRSAHLSPGYWNRPDLTEAKFKPDIDDPQKQLYYTGDLALMRPDGCLLHQGRKDNRVKIRGFGVDIAEVENTLRQHPKVAEALVRVNSQQDDSLTGYFVASPGQMVAPGELRAFLKMRLADPMVPTRFVALDQFPLTPNGKIDRQALPDPSGLRPDLANPYIVPKTKLERELTNIWAQVLKLDRVGVDDNFFELGGHSLTAAKVIAKIIETFRLVLPLSALFDAPAVANMAAIIERHSTDKASDDELEKLLSEVEALTEEEARKQSENRG